MTCEPAGGDYVAARRTTPATLHDERTEPHDPQNQHDSGRYLHRPVYFLFSCTCFGSLPSHLGIFIHNYAVDGGAPERGDVCRIAVSGHHWSWYCMVEMAKQGYLLGVPNGGNPGVHLGISPNSVRLL